MRILITGGYGFVGTHLAIELSKEHEVTVFGKDEERNTFKYFREHLKNVSTEKGDILDLGKLSWIIRDNIDVVIHCAAIAGVSNYFKKPTETAITNGVGTFNVLEACKDNSVKKVIVLSSSEVYGDGDFFSEDSPSILSSVKNSRLTYSISKLYGDLLSLSYHRQYGMNVCSIRPFGVFGPGQIGEGFIQIACRRAVRDEDIPVVNAGKQMRDWCYIKDFVEAIKSCMYSNSISGEIINIGNPENYKTIFDLAKQIVDLSNSSSKIKFIDRTNVKDTQFRCSNIEKARKLINFKNRYSLQNALLETIEWYKENNVGEDISF